MGAENLLIKSLIHLINRLRHCDEQNERSEFCEEAICMSEALPQRTDRLLRHESLLTTNSLSTEHQKTTSAFRYSYACPYRGKFSFPFSSPRRLVNRFLSG